MPPLPDAIIQVFAPFAPLCSARGWLQAHVLLLGALRSPGARTVTAAWRAMGLAAERHVPNEHRVLTRASWSARQGRRLLLGWLRTLLGPPGATVVLGAEDTVARRSGRKIAAQGCDRDAGRSPKTHVLHCVGLQWVSMRLVGPVPWSRRRWAWPCLTARCWPETKRGPRRHQSRVDGVRPMMKPGRRWLPGRRLVVVVDGGVAAVALALACGHNRVTVVSRWRWDAARHHPPGPQPQGKRGPNPRQGKRQRSVPGWAERADTPGEPVEVTWDGGPRKQWWVVSRTAVWDPPGWPPVELRDVLVADPEGKLRREACCCTALQATPAQLREGVVMRWSVAVPLDEGRAHRGLETQRQGSDQAIARTTPVLLALCSLITMLALQLRHSGPIPGPVTAWYRTAAPTFSDCLALVRRHLWRARYVVNSAPEAAIMPLPREALDRLIHGVPLAA